MKDSYFKINTTAILVGCAIVFSQQSISSAGTENNYSENPRYEEIKSKYKAQFDALKKEGEELSKNGPSPTEIEAIVNVDFDISWETTSMKFDMPEVVMKTREFKLHLPQFRMKRHSIKWDNIEFRMETKVVGKYPCFRGFKWYSCDAKMDIPVSRTVRREAKFDLPETYWDITSFKMDIPEFFSRRVEWKLDLPQFKAQDVKAGIKRQQAAARVLATKARAVGKKQKAEFLVAAIDELKGKRSLVEGQFARAISMMVDGIERIKSRGANPEAILVDDKSTNLVGELKKLRSKRAATLKTIDDKIRELSSMGV